MIQAMFQWLPAAFAIKSGLIRGKQIQSPSAALAGKLDPGFLFVTPGIKGTTTPAGADQKRVMSPGRAVAAGSSLLVVGRAITGAADKKAAAREILQDIANVLSPDR
mgnify:CR=1 FL=1